MGAAIIATLATPPPTVACPRCGGTWFGRDEDGDAACITCGARLYQISPLLPSQGEPCSLALSHDEISQLAMLARARHASLGDYLRSQLRRAISLDPPPPPVPELTIRVPLDAGEWRHLRRLARRRDWPLPLVLRAIALEVLASDGKDGAAR